MTTAAPVGGDCWNRIGIAGDRSCPELEPHVHCRNCPVYASAAQRFFERPAPDGYLADWARTLAEPLTPADAEEFGALIFRLRGEWLALPTRVVVEVTATRPIHRVPHRSDAALVGLVSLRGQLHLQVSLHGLLGVDVASGGAGGGSRRLVLIRRDGPTWAFEADEVFGVERFARGRLSPVPSTLADDAGSFSQAVIPWRDRSVGLIDDDRLFGALRGLGP